MPSLPPQSGYGPSNYSGARSEGPGVPFDATINYNNMAQYQAVTQYQQLSTPAPIYQQRSVTAGEQYQYGAGQQNVRFYNRQQDLSRMAWSAAVANAGMGIAGFAAADAAMGVAGAAAAGAGAAGFGMAGTVMPWVAPLIPLYFAGRGVNNSMQRRAYMHAIANDIETYRDRLGFNSLSYNQASQLGAGMTAEIESPYQFFNREQQMRIHKIALANDMISAKGIGLQSGSIEQYKRNFSELKDTTETVVKLLKTTIEGGMSVIKELQGAGFNSYRQIRQQVLQATAYGNLTGLGSQNMMQVGLAGAQSVQGTMWTAATGASMYQSGAAQAAGIARTSALGAYAVERVGGVAQAGGVIARATMNLAMSGIGTRMAAYAMNPDGSVNQERMQAMMRGDISGFGITSGSAATGYAMGPSGRALFPIYKEQFYNNLNDQGRDMILKKGFGAWSASRPYASVEAKAYTFAGQYTQDPREQLLVMQSLLGSGGYSNQYAAKHLESRIASQSIGFNPLAVAAGNWYQGSVFGKLERVGVDAFNATDDAMSGIGFGINQIRRGASRRLSNAIGGMFGMEGAWSTALPMDIRGGLSRALGQSDYGGGAEGLAAYREMSGRRAASLRVKGAAFSADAMKAINGLSSADALDIANKLQAASYSLESPDAAIRNLVTGDLRTRSILSSPDMAGVKSALMNNSVSAAYTFTNLLSKRGYSAKAQQEEAMGEQARFNEKASRSQVIQDQNTMNFARRAIAVANNDQLTNKLFRQSSYEEYQALISGTSFTGGVEAGYGGTLEKLRDAKLDRRQFNYIKSQYTKGDAALSSVQSNGIDIAASRARAESYASYALGGFTRGGAILGESSWSGGYVGDTVGDVANIAFRQLRRGSIGDRATALNKLGKRFGVNILASKSLSEQQDAMNAIVLGVSEARADVVVGENGVKTEAEAAQIRRQRAETIRQYKALPGSIDFDKSKAESDKFDKAVAGIKAESGARAAATLFAKANTWKLGAISLGSLSYAKDADDINKMQDLLMSSETDKKIDWSQFKNLKGITGSLGTIDEVRRSKITTIGELQRFQNQSVAAYNPESGSSELTKAILDLTRSLKDPQIAGNKEKEAKVRQQIDDASKALPAKLAEEAANARQTGTTTPIATTPPVLNYWSNQWVL